MANSFTIRDTTSLAQLNAFVSNDVNQGSKLLARHNERGEAVLYEKPKPTSFGDKVSALVDRVLGRTERRQERAHQAIQSVFTRFEQENPRTGTRGQSATTTLFGHVEAVLTAKTSAGQLTGGAVAELANAATTIVRSLPNSTDVVPNQVLNGPTLQSIGMAPNHDAIVNAGPNLGNNDQRLAAANTLGDAIVSSFLATNPSANERESFALSDGKALRSELKTTLQALVGNQQPPVTNEAIDVLVDHAFNRAASKMLPDMALDGPTTGIATKFETVQLPNVRIGGEDYKPNGYLGEGGFAHVYEYVSVNDPSDKIAFKLAKEDSSDAIKEAVTEIGVHQSAFGAGSNQVLGIEGTIRLPDGRIGIAVEHAPNGTVFEMSEKLHGSISDAPLPGTGKISANEANIVRLTMLKDMVQGLDHLHSTQQVTHYDFKSPNCFIGTDGTTKVADFGLSLETEDTTGLNKAGSIDNPFFKAPELLRAEDVRSRINALTTETVKVETGREKAKLAKLLPMASEQALNVLAGSILEPRKKELEDDKLSDQSMLFFDRKVDVWGMGSSALEMFTGNLPVGHNRWQAQAADDLRDFGMNRTNAPLSNADQDGKPTNGAIGIRTGNNAIDNLMSRMLAPDPRDRASTTDLLGDPALSINGVGSNEAKALIIALRSGDAGKIDLARQALAGVM